MKTLILLRHAKTEEKRMGQTDAERILVERGEKEAGKVGKMLIEKKYFPDYIYCSPAIRTRQTYHIVALYLKLDQHGIELNPKLYEATLEDVLSCIQNTSPSIETMMIIGHNPSITYAAEFLTGEDIAHVPPSGAVVMALDSWSSIKPGSGQLLYFHLP